MIPQAVVITLLVIALIMNIIHHGEEKPRRKFDAVNAIVRAFIIFFLLGWGGFFDGII